MWTALYVMMAVAAWRVWRTGRAERAGAPALFGLQLVLNLLWLVLFFGLRAIGPALIDIVLLVLAIIATAIAFLRIDRTGAALLLPNLAWVAFAAVPNAQIWLLN